MINLKSHPDQPYVLIIEHDPALRKIMELSLRQAGLEVRSISRYANALQILAQKIPDIFIVDFDLRDGDPGKLIAAYRRQSKLSGNSLVVSTAERLKDEWRRKHQPDAVLYKPFDIRHLIRLISVYAHEKAG